MSEHKISTGVLSFGKEKLGKCLDCLINSSRFLTAFMMLFIASPLYYHVFLYKLEDKERCFEMAIDAERTEVLLYPLLGLYLVIWFWVYLLMGMVSGCKKKCKSKEVKLE
jgi:hypothetical protein